MNPTKRKQANAALTAVKQAIESPHFGVVAIHFPKANKPGTLHLHPWKMTAGDAMAVIRKLQEHFGLPPAEQCEPATTSTP